MTLYDVHADLAWFVVVANGLVGCWALGANWLAPLRGRALWVAIAVAQVSIFVQVIAGVIMVAGQGIEAPGMHMFYGYVSLIAVGLIYSYRQQVARYRYLLYGGGSLFLMGMALRAMVLG
jgi:hypothetical protein